MFVKKILSAFTDDTRIKVYRNELDYGYNTVGEFMNSGLMTYSEAELSSFMIENNTIIIYLN